MYIAWSNLILTSHTWGSEYSMIILFHFAQVFFHSRSSSFCLSFRTVYSIQNLRCMIICTQMQGRTWYHMKCIAKVHSILFEEEKVWGLVFCFKRFRLSPLWLSIIHLYELISLLLKELCSWYSFIIFSKYESSDKYVKYFFKI